MKKVASVKLAEIDQKFPKAKSSKIKSIKDDDLKWVVLKFKKTSVFEYI